MVPKEEKLFLFPRKPGLGHLADMSLPLNKVRQNAAQLLIANIGRDTVSVRNV